MFDEAEAELRAIQEGGDVVAASRQDWRVAWLREWAELRDKARDGRLAEAEEAHRKATSLRGDVDEAFLNLGLVLRAQGRFEEAAEAFECALAICAKYEEASEALADVREAIALRRPATQA